MKEERGGGEGARRTYELIKNSNLSHAEHVTKNTADFISVRTPRVAERVAHNARAGRACRLRVLNNTHNYYYVYMYDIYVCMCTCVCTCIRAHHRNKLWNSLFEWK